MNVANSRSENLSLEKGTEFGVISSNNDNNSNVYYCNDKVVIIIVIIMKIIPE